MKKTRTVVFARCLIVLAMMSFVAAVVSQSIISNIYIVSTLYFLAIISFSINGAGIYCRSKGQRAYEKR